MTTFVAGGRATLNQPLIATATTLTSLSIPANLRGNYQFSYYFVNRVGSTGYAPATNSIAVDENTQITLSTPLDLIKDGEIWHSIVFCARKDSGQWFPVYEHFLFDLNNPLNWRHCHNVIIPDVILNKVDHYRPYRVVSSQNDLLTVDTTDWLNGSLVFVDQTGTFYKIYKTPYLSFNVPTILNNDESAAFAFCSYGSSSPADVGLSANISLVELRGLTVTHRVINYRPVYLGSGDEGFPLYFILANTSEEAVPQGTRVGFHFFIQDDDYSRQLGHLFCARNLGFVNLTTFDWDKTDGQTTADMLGLNVERKCLPEQNNFILTRNLPSNWGMLVQVYPKFHLYQLPATIPNLFDVFIEPFLFLHPTKYVELGEVFGDFVLDSQGRRFVLPHQSFLAIVKSGSGLVKSYSFKQLADTPLVGVQPNSNAPQYVYLDVNGYPKVTTAPLTEPDINIHALRAIIKTQPGYTFYYLAGTYDMDITASFTFTHSPATAIRDSYPVIGGVSIPSKGKFAVVAKYNNVYKLNLFTYDTTPQIYTFDWSAAQTLNNGWADLNIVNDSLFGFWSPVNRIQSVSFTAGSTTVKLYILDYYDGTQLSYADHRPESGCMPVLKGSIQQFLSLLSNYGQAVQTVADLKAVPANQITDYQQRYVLYPKPTVYIYYPELTAEESFLIARPNHILASQPGRWRRIAYESSRGYAHLYKVSNNTMDYGVIKLVQPVGQPYIELSYRTYENFDIDLFIQKFDSNTVLLIHSAFDFSDSVHITITHKSKITNSSDNLVCWRLFIDIPNSNLTQSSVVFSENNLVYLSASVFRPSYFQSIYRATLKIFTSTTPVTPQNGEITAYPTATSSSIYTLHFSDLSLDQRPFSLIDQVLAKRSIILLRPLDDLVSVAKLEVLNKTGNQITASINFNFLSLNNKDVEVIVIPTSFTKSDFEALLYEYKSNVDLTTVQTGQFRIINNEELIISKKVNITYNNTDLNLSSFIDKNKIYELINRTGQIIRFLVIKKLEENNTNNSIRFFTKLLYPDTAPTLTNDDLYLLSFKESSNGIPVIVNQTNNSNFVPDNNLLERNYIYFRAENSSQQQYTLFADLSLNIAENSTYSLTYANFNKAFIHVRQHTGGSIYTVTLLSGNLIFDILAYLNRENSSTTGSSNGFYSFWW